MANTVFLLHNCTFLYGDDIDAVFPITSIFYFCYNFHLSMFARLDWNLESTTEWINKSVLLFDNIRIKNDCSSADVHILGKTTATYYTPQIP